MSHPACPPKSTRRATGLVAMTLCTLLAACGGGGSAPESPQSTAPPAPAPAPTPAPAPAPSPAPGASLAVRQLDTGGVALGVASNSQQGVAVADVPVTLHTEDGTLYATRWPAGATSPQGQALAAAVDNATLAVRGDRLLAVYLQTAPLRQLVARESPDGGQTWEPPQAIAAVPAGAVRPSACLFDQAGALKRLVVFSAPPSGEQGPLLVARHDGDAWQAPATTGAALTAGAALACADQQVPEVVWRDHRDTTGGGAAAIWQAGIDMDTAALRGERHLVQPGLDGSQCRAGERRFAGWHDSLDTAHLAYSDDAWQSRVEVDADAATPGEQLDDHGRFVAVACNGDTVAVVWGDWPSRSDANALAATRQLAMRVSRDRGASWSTVQPAGTDLDQGPATVAVHADGRVAVFWRAQGGLRLATLAAP